jgi:hypothetical protein
MARARATAATSRAASVMRAASRGWDRRPPLVSPVRAVRGLIAQLTAIFVQTAASRRDVISAGKPAVVSKEARV